LKLCLYKHNTLQNSPVKYNHCFDKIESMNWRRRDVIEHPASNQKFVNPWFDSRHGIASLCPWERHLMLFLILGPSSLSVVVAQPDERHANRTASVLE